MYLDISGHDWWAMEEFKGGVAPFQQRYAGSGARGLSGMKKGPLIARCRMINRVAILYNNPPPLPFSTKISDS